MMNYSDLVKIGHKPGGSVPGAVYKDSRGVPWIVKYVASDLHAKNEVLAAALYKEAGVRVPVIDLVFDKAKKRLYVASKIEVLSQAPLSNKLTGLMEGLVIDAWLANWDVVGLDYDNVMYSPVDKLAVRVDVGGSLLFRAQGGLKGSAFTTTVIEVLTLLDKNINKQSANVFKDLRILDVKVGLQMLTCITPDIIKGLVEYYHMDSELADILIARREWLLGGDPQQSFTVH